MVFDVLGGLGGTLGRILDAFGCHWGCKNAKKIGIGSKLIQVSSRRGQSGHMHGCRGFFGEPGGGQSSYLEVPVGSGGDLGASASRGLINKETRKPIPTAW